MRSIPPRRKGKLSVSRNRMVGIEQLEDRLLLSAQLVISEFMAKNKSTLKDDTGLFSDWIELHNAGDTSADLNGWSLTDSASKLTEWTFPAGATLAPGAFMIVWASGLDHETLGQPFHTNFKLDDSGEYLALVQPDGVTIQQQFAPTFPPQSSDISYGLSDDNDINSTDVYFSTPSPGAPNIPNAAAVTFSKPGGGYTTSFTDVLSSLTPNVQIRYTTNGAVPTATSTLYTGPISIARDTVVRAIAVGTGLINSPITSEQYFLLDATTATFHSNLPLIVIDTNGSSIGQTTQTPVSAMVINTPAAGDTTLTQTPDFEGRAGLNIRGQSSTGFPKLQYHFELWDQSNNDAKHPLLGMPSDSDWVLYAPYSEKSLMQNELAYKWANEMGEYAVRTQWVEVFLNTSGQGAVNYSRDYVGIYLLEEKIKIAPNRVDIAKISPGDDTLPDITGGYIWHKDKTDPGDTSSFTSETGQTFLYEDPTGTDLDPAQKAYLTSYVNQFETALYGPNFADPAQGYAKYINVQSFVDNWIMVEMAKNIDGFRLSTFYYKDRNGLITMGPIWDYNLSMGNANYNGGDSPTGWYHDNISSADYTYFDRLTQDPNFMALIAARWEQLRQTVFSTSSLMADIDANFNLLTDGNGNIPVGTNPTQTPNNPVVRNFEKWNILGTYVWPNSYIGNSWLDEVNHLKTFMSTRVAWMDSQLDSLVPTAPPGTPSSLHASALSGVQINLTWTLADSNATIIHIDESSDGGTTWKPLTDISGSATTSVVGGLTPGTTYTFRIRAANALGSSDNSNSASATTSFQIPNLDYPNFTGSTDTLNFNGSANINSGSGQLTPNLGGQVGSIWSINKQDIRKFTTTFSFLFNNAAADGMTFTIQNTSNTALGGAGGSLGYAGIAKSLAIKFDIYPNLSTTGLYTNGAAPGEDNNAINTTGVDFHAGHTYSCTLTYDGSNLYQTITDTSTGGTFSYTYSAVGLTATLGGTTAWVGFTAATGGATADIRVLSWSFSTIPSDPPKPPTALTATAINGNQINLAWTDNSSDEDDFKIFRKTGVAGVFDLLMTVAAGATSYHDTTVLPNNDYYYYVVANNLAGDSTPTATVLAHTPVPPRVTQVYLAGSAWTPDFIAALSQAGLGAKGYAIPIGAVQLNDLPWTGLNQISISFDQTVTVAQGDLQLYGVNTPSYTFSGFSYDPGSNTATWTLGAPLTEDKLLIDLSDSVSNINGALDGEFTTAASNFPSGNGVAGGHFMFRFNVLPGDVNQDLSVLGNDVVLVRNAQFATPGLSAYSPFYDVDGSATLFGNDVVLVRNQQFHFLPSGEPSAPIVPPVRGAVPPTSVAPAKPDVSAAPAKAASAPVSATVSQPAPAIVTAPAVVTAAKPAAAASAKAFTAVTSAPAATSAALVFATAPLIKSIPASALTNAPQAAPILKTVTTGTITPIITTLAADGSPPDVGALLGTALPLLTSPESPDFSSSSSRKKARL